MNLLESSPRPELEKRRYVLSEHPDLLRAPAIAIAEQLSSLSAGDGYFSAHAIPHLAELTACEVIVLPGMSRVLQKLLKRRAPRFAQCSADADHSRMNRRASRPNRQFTGGAGRNPSRAHGTSSRAGDFGKLARGFWGPLRSGNATITSAPASQCEPFSLSLQVCAATWKNYSRPSAPPNSPCSMVKPDAGTNPSAQQSSTLSDRSLILAHVALGDTISHNGDVAAARRSLRMRLRFFVSSRKCRHCGLWRRLGRPIDRHRQAHLSMYDSELSQRHLHHHRGDNHHNDSKIRR